MQTLRMLLVDDDDPPGCREAVLVMVNRIFPNSRIGSLCELDEAYTFDLADEYIGGGNGYDLILLDVRLNDNHEWGGIELLDKHWSRINQIGTRIIVYSGKHAAKTAFEWFSSGRGPFLFSKKDSEFDGGPELLNQLARLLRSRVQSLCQRAHVTWDESGLVRTVKIDGKPWNIDSLVAPFLYLIPGEREVKRELVIAALFPGSNLVRMCSYFFKARAFAWPEDSVYGLTKMQPYHCGGGSKTSALDALMHEPNGPQQFQSAYERAIADLESIGRCRELKCSQKIRDYAVAVVNNYGNRIWSDLDQHAKQLFTESADEFKKSFRFSLRDLLDTLSTRGIAGPEKLPSDLESYSWNELYCPPSSFDESVPTVVHGLCELAKSISSRIHFEGRPGNVRGSADHQVEGLGSLATSQNNREQELPTIRIIIRHNGAACQPHESIRGWFEAGSGHGLSDARESLKGCANWYVLSGSGGKITACDSVMAWGMLDSNVASEWWSRWSDAGRWNVVHIVDLPVPASRIYSP